MEGFIISLICSSLASKTNEWQACLKGTEAVSVSYGFRQEFITAEQNIAKFAIKNTSKEVQFAAGTILTTAKYNGFYYSVNVGSKASTVVTIVGPARAHIQYIYKF